MPALKDQLVGNNFKVTTLNGETSYLDMDSAASTPPFKEVVNGVNEILSTYGSVHRGAGYKSIISTDLYEQSIENLLKFIGVSSKSHIVITTSNATTAINKLSRILDITESDALFVSEFEHSANDITWRKSKNVTRIPYTKSGFLDLEFLESNLRLINHKKNRSFVVITGASSITGEIQPIIEAARIANKYGAKIIVDAAQLVAHREINMVGKDYLIDFVCFSGHKMYAPYGSGIIVAGKEYISYKEPDELGGGNIMYADANRFIISDDPGTRFCAGSPNLIGIFAAALSGKILRNGIGFDTIINHEKALMKELQSKLSSIEGLEVYGANVLDPELTCSNFVFNFVNIPPALTASRLSYEFGIGVRSGPICQYSYVSALLGVEEELSVQNLPSQFFSVNRENYGIVRVSMGLSITSEGIQRLVEALKHIGQTYDYNQEYQIDSLGNYSPKAFNYNTTKNYFEV